jgi:hypothetical protein
MTLSTPLSLIGSEFDDFLFAPIGEDKNGMQLSVLSALARSNVDPWEEAANLARLPGETATQRLASLISPLPDDASGHLEPGLVARLVALLPRGTGFNIRSHEISLDRGAVIKSRAAIVAIYVIFMVLVLTAQSFIAVRRLPAQVDNAQAPAASTAYLQLPPPSFSP